MTEKQHREYHVHLYAQFDILLADYIEYRMKHPIMDEFGETSVLDHKIKDLIEWSYKQTKKPD